jgi:bifunctional non-homologous end joining protein LigD
MIVPMLSKATENLPGGKNYLYEIKLDGQRTVAEISKNKLLLYTRNRQAVTKKYPELSGLSDCVNKKDAIIDGEIVALKDGIPSFELLQQRMSLHDLRTLPGVIETVPVLYYAFDILSLNGKSLLRTPLIERKQILKESLQVSETIKILPYFESKEITLQKALDFGYEGVVAKKKDSFYYPGARTDCWLKFKFQLVDSFVIGGWLEGGRSQGFGSLLVGKYDGRKLSYCGRVGTGFDEAAVSALMKTFKMLSAESCPFTPRPSLPRGVHWLTPKLVADVKFKEWTNARILRAPVFLGLRPDLKAHDAVFPSPIE